MKIEDRILARKKEQDKNNAWHAPVIGKYHASALYDICKGYKKPEDFFKKETFSDQTLLIFEIGNMYHEYIQGFFPVTSREIKVKLETPDFKIVGRVDLLLNDEVPVELKTCSRLPKNYYPAHEYQLQAYLRGLDKPCGYLTYIEKNPKTIVSKDFKIERDDKLMDEIVKQIKQFHEKLIQIQKNDTK